MAKIKYDDSYIGKKFNYLTVIGFAYNNSHTRCFKCLCDCGNEKTLIPINVIAGTVKSCGCMSEQLLHDIFWKEDALNKQRLYRIWIGMKGRCYNQNADNYQDYGGRRIKICDEWLKSYDAFKNWAMNNGYSDKLSIDRIDNDGNYEPSNCRWATAKEQRANQRPHKGHKKRTMITVNGIERPKRDVCAEYGISAETFDYRVKHMGMSVIEALTTPKMSVGRPNVAS